METGHCVDAPGEVAAGADQPRREPPAFVANHRAVFDAIMMLIYTVVVHVWGLTVHPLGRDYAALADPSGLPWLARTLFAWETQAFGAHALPYHVVNVALLYGCMICAYHFARSVLRGPAWLGTWVAVMFMANPVHAESVLNLSGVADLLPALAALAALAGYASIPREPDARIWSRLVLALGLMAVAVFPYRSNLGVGAVILLFEWLARKPNERKWGRALLFTAISVIAGLVHGGALTRAAWDVGVSFGPLYLVFYPIGLLPETADRFVQWPWLGWVSAAAVALVAGLISRKVQRSLMLFGLAGMLALRIGQGDRFVDWVHMIGGGSLLTANVLFNIALAVMFWRMMDHPKWRQPVVMITTILCVVFFAMQIRANLIWKQTGTFVQTVQQDARGMHAGNGPVGLMPDYQYLLGAPVCLGEALRYTTPFGPGVKYQSLLPVHDAGKSARVQVVTWTGQGGAVRIEGVKPVQAACYPYTLAHAGGVVKTADAVVEVTKIEGAAVEVSIEPLSGELPVQLLPREVASK